MKKTSPMLWALGRMKKHLPAMLLKLTSHVVNALLQVAFALGTQQVIDTAVSGDWDAFARAVLVQAGIILGILLTLTLCRHLNDWLEADLDRSWKRELLHGLLHGEYSQVSGYHSGELLNRMNNDVRVVITGILSTLPSLATLMIRMIAAMAVLASMEPLFTSIVVAFGIVVVFATALMRRRLKDLNKRVSASDGKVSGFLQETLEKLLMVQAMDVSEEMEKRSEKLMGERFLLQRKRKNVSLFANTSISVMAYGASFFALVWCSAGLLDGTMTFGTLTAMNQLVGQLQAPFVNMSGIIPQYIAMTAAAERLQELYAISGEAPPAGTDRDELYEKATAIRAEAITFGYDRKKVLDHAEFCLPKGEFVAIVGQSGIGKSTLLKLMLGIYKPESGRLLLQTPEADVELDRTTRRLFAYVPQGNLLLSGTLRENLTITCPDATQEQIDQAIYVSAMDEYLPELPKGLETVLGESGTGLSEGQAQRLSIARAVLSGAPVLLLDEATSALDGETEQTVLRRLRELPGKTCIAVTHRPAALEVCQWKLELGEGECTLTPLA